MKTGKYVPLGYYKNIKIGYGTINYKDLKTIYLKLNAWILPECDDDYEKIIYQTRKNIKVFVTQLNSEYFKKESIVDLDIRTKGVKIDKKSFMNLEITLFVEKQFDVKENIIKIIIKNLLINIIDDYLTNKSLFNFYKRKEKC